MDFLLISLCTFQRITIMEREESGYIFVTKSHPKLKNWKSYDKAVVDGDFEYLKSKPIKNPIYIDKKQGRLHMETPHVNIVDGKVYLTYHKQFLKGFGRNQPTLLSFSLDAINFQRIHGNRDSIILRDKIKNWNTGYFRWAPNPFHRINYKFIGYSLLHGGKNFRTAMWGSHDAINWEIIQIFACMERVGMEEPDKIMNWHGIDPSSVQRINEDEYVMIADASNRAWGNQKRRTEIYEIFVAGDGKTLTRKSRKILSHGSTSSLDSEEASTPTMIKINDIWHLIYIGTTKNAQLNTVMAAKGEFNPNAPLSLELTTEERQRNFFK